MDLVNGIAVAALDKEAHRIDSKEAAAAAQARVRRLLASPLSDAAAVQIALINNKGLQAAYNELGIADAVRLEASLPPSPTISAGGISTPVELDIEQQIVVDILALATLPARTEIADDRFHQAQLHAAEETLRVAAEARHSYYRAVASRQLVAFLGQAETAAETAAKLADELARTGAMNKLDQAREQSFSAEVSVQLAEAQQKASSDREALMRALGLSGDDDLAFKLPQTLRPLPKRPKNLPGIEAEALRRRVDLQIARLEVGALAKSYGLTKATRFINLLEVGGISRTQSERAGLQGTGGGGAVEFQVPIFDFGEARLQQAAESYNAAVNRLAEKAVTVRSEARNAYKVYRSAYDIAARYRDRVLPLRQTITEETTLRYGAMQIDVFSLLAEARQRVNVNLAAIAAQRDFWLANVNLDTARFGGGEVRNGAPSATATGAAIAASE